MTIRVGVNGFGRIGRNFFRALDAQQAAGKAKDIVGPTYNSFDSNLWNVGTWTREQP